VQPDIYEIFLLGSINAISPAIDGTNSCSAASLRRSGAYGLQHGLNGGGTTSTPINEDRYFRRYNRRRRRGGAGQVT
jgi:hypothetical protein